ncbi:MAG TPA: HNH endonuclease signature motif containing protein [Chthoniobacterales bacterium]|nr:HNH endonuclease signature motif containing protein [Chthoniobacterales bacterium]
MNLFLALAFAFSFFGNAPPHNALLPNPKLTPGRVAKSEKERSGVTLAMERKVFARYHLPWERRARFKIDHLIPLELGGADTIDNLWPQKLEAKPYGPERKELLTQVLLEKVRSGRLTLEQAQEEIRRDWIDAFIDHIGMVYLQPGFIPATG